MIIIAAIVLIVGLYWKCTFRQGCWVNQWKTTTVLRKRPERCLKLGGEELVRNQFTVF